MTVLCMLAHAASSDLRTQLYPLRTMNKAAEQPQTLISLYALSAGKPLLAVRRRNSMLPVASLLTIFLAQSAATQMHTALGPPRGAMSTSMHANGVCCIQIAVHILRFLP